MLSVSRGSFRRIGPLRYFGHLLGCMVLQGILQKSPLLPLLLLRLVRRIGYVCMSWPRILRPINISNLLIFQLASNASAVAFVRKPLTSFDSCLHSRLDDTRYHRLFNWDASPLIVLLVQ